nr:MAG TPA: hypothetical protein [Bacteriophage sp.]
MHIFHSFFTIFRFFFRVKIAFSFFIIYVFASKKNNDCIIRKTKRY